MTQYAFYFDSNRCTGCRACQVACKENHGLGVDMLWRRVYEYQGGSWKLNDVGSYVPDGVFGYFVSVACNHCANPACVQVCPTGAMQKDGETGIVWTDHEVCIGCRACQAACPYHAPSFDAEYTDAPASETMVYFTPGVSRITSAMNCSLSPEAVPLPMDTTSTPYFRISRSTVSRDSRIFSCGFVG